MATTEAPQVLRNQVSHKIQLSFSLVQESETDQSHRVLE